MTFGNTPSGPAQSLVPNKVKSEMSELTRSKDAPKIGISKLDSFAEEPPKNASTNRSADRSDDDFGQQESMDPTQLQNLAKNELKGYSSKEMEVIRE